MLEFLLNTFPENTVLVRTSAEDLNSEELAAWQKHKHEGYEDFANFKGMKVLKKSNGIVYISKRGISKEYLKTKANIISGNFRA